MRGRLKQYRTWQALVSGQAWKRKPTQKPRTVYHDQLNMRVCPVLLYEDGVLVVLDLVKALLGESLQLAACCSGEEACGSIRGRVKHGNGSHV
jgi:hypothetical protein